jgi:Family of unknown function (DUF6353)
LNIISSTFFKLKGQAKHLAHTNSPALLTALGISGTITTSYLTGKASYEAALVIKDSESQLLLDIRTTKEKIVDRFPLVWELYIPAGISGTLTIACIITATRVSSRRTAAIAAAYSITEKAFEEYREKVSETIGVRKEQDIRDKIAPSDKHLLLAGPGNVLCCELFTGRYFNSDMETLRRAQNDINAKLYREMYASLNDFYYLVGLSYTENSGEVGWNSDRQLELYFSTVLSEDNRPCITISYNYTKAL